MSYVLGSYPNSLPFNFNLAFNETLSVRDMRDKLRQAGSVVHLQRPQCFLFCDRTVIFCPFNVSSTHGCRWSISLCNSDLIIWFAGASPNQRGQSVFLLFTSSFSSNSFYEQSVAFFLPPTFLLLAGSTLIGSI